jgi:hypothetical protein
MTAARTKPLTDREITVKFRLKRLLVPALIASVLILIGLGSLLHRGRQQARDGGQVDRGSMALPDLTQRENPAQAVKRAGRPGTSGPGAEPGSAPGGVPEVKVPSLGQRAGSTILGLLSPYLKNPSKFLGEKDLQELERGIAEFKEQHPQEAGTVSQWLDSIQGKIEEAKKLQAAGDTEASKRSYDRSESEMRKLLSQVSERERAEAAFKELEETKRRMGAAPGTARPNLLTWIALEKEKDAKDAFAKNDFSGARILCGILSRVHLLSPRATDEGQALAALSELTETIRQDADAAQAQAKQAWLYERAVSEEDGARQTAKDGLAPQAAEQYILASFLYEKAKEVSVESAQAGRH